MILTIYTPTYNREKLLPRIYQSLCEQTIKDFVWLVIDDGSTDQTRSLVASWKERAPFGIKYVYKDNGGVHTAHNLAHNIVETDLIWYVDSDDWLECDAVEKILGAWTNNDEYLGIFAKVRAPSRSPKNKFPNVNQSTYQDFFYNYHYDGDLAIVVRTEVLKKVRPFPVYSGEKLVSESFKWIQLPEIPFLVLDEYVACKEYQQSGYTNNVRKGFFSNLNGYCELYDIHLKCAKYLKNRIEYGVKYIIASSFLKKKNFIIKSSRPGVILLLYPFGKLLFWGCNLKWKKYQ